MTLDTLKINEAGQAEIISVYAWMDGGTVTVQLATIDNLPLEIEFTQKVYPEISDTNPNPGRIVFNKKVVEIRSNLEAEIISTLKNAIYSDNPSHDNKDFRTCLIEAINFVETNDYVLLANETGNKNRTSK